MIFILYIWFCLDFRKFLSLIGPFKFLVYWTKNLLSRLRDKVCPPLHIQIFNFAFNSSTRTNLWWGREHTLIFLPLHKAILLPLYWTGSGVVQSKVLILHAESLLLVLLLCLHISFSKLCALCHILLDFFLWNLKKQMKLTSTSDVSPKLMNSIAVWSFCGIIGFTKALTEL